MDLVALFRGLARPNTENGSNIFHAKQIPEFSSHRLGKDSEGAPLFLIHIAERSGRPSGPIVLQHISVQHDVQCRISGEEEPSFLEDTFSLVRCLSGEPVLRDYFVRAVELIVRQIGVTPTRSDVNRSLRRLTELFRSFEQPARRTVQGLWAELVLITFCADPELLLAAWHNDPEEAFDFAIGPSRIEVKSFSGLSRVHRFSLRQVHPGSYIEVVIASVLAERSSGGASISDLMRAIVQRGVGIEAASKLEEIVAQSLGELAATGLAITFDLERARQSLRYFDAASIPSVNPELPPGVLRVNFESLLDESRALSVPELRARGGLFESARFR